jgi:hypothetical protein
LIIATQNITPFSRNNPIITFICLRALPISPNVQFENNVIRDFDSNEKLESKKNLAKKNYETTCKFQDSWVVQLPWA